jgi:hypothetical protein
MPSSSRQWIVLFLILAALGLAAVTIPIVYNLAMQLHPEQVAHARRLWQQHAPSDYDLEMLIRTEHGSSKVDEEFFVAVRGGRALFLGCNGEVFYADPSLALLAGPGLLALPQEDPRPHTVEGLFDSMEETLRQDVSVGGRNYCTASFDEADGHPLHFIHRIRGTHDRVEWFVRLVKPGEN